MMPTMKTKNVKLLIMATKVYIEIENGHHFILQFIGYGDFVFLVKIGWIYSFMGHSQLKIQKMESMNIMYRKICTKFRRNLKVLHILINVN